MNRLARIVWNALSLFCAVIGFPIMLGYGWMGGKLESEGTERYLNDFLTKCWQCGALVVALLAGIVLLLLFSPG